MFGERLSRVFMQITNLIDNYYIRSLGKIIIIILLIKLLQWIAALITVKAFTFRYRNGVSKSSSREQLIKNVLPIILSAERYLLYFVGLIAILGIFNINTSALLTSAGILGLAFSFGAQNVVKDFISGFFLLFDGLIKVGDVVSIGEVGGEVEKLDLRNVMIREYSGRLWAIPNGEVRSFANFNRDWMRAIVEIPLAYENDIKKVMLILQQVTEQWVEKNKEIVLETPIIQGLMSLDEYSVTIRIVVKVLALQQWTAERELRLLSREHLAKLGIEVPYRKTVVIKQLEKEI